MRFACTLPGHLMIVALTLPGLPGCTSNEGLGGGIHMDPIKGAIELEGRHRDETYFVSGTNLPKTVIKENAIRGSIKLDLEGDVYHSRLFAYRALLDLGYEQIQQKQTSTQKTELTNNFFDIRGEFFRQKAYTADAYTFRTQLETRQSFFATSDAVLFEYGGNLRAREWVVPSWLHFSRRDYEGRVGDTRKEVRDTLRLAGSTRGDGLFADYRLEYNSIEANTVPEPYDDYQAAVNLNWDFGEDSQHLVGATGFYRKQTGFFANQVSNLSGRLDLGLNEDLDWKSRILFDKTIYEGNQGVPSKKIQWGSFLEHDLFESLTSTIGLDGFDQKFGDGKIQRNGARLLFDYRKYTDIGRLNIVLNPSAFIQDESGNPDRLIPVLDEAHVYTVGVPIFLNELRVDAATILITDRFGLTIYSVPADYTVAQSNQTTEIIISVGSRIQPGDTILVSYRYSAGSDRKFRSLNSQANISIAFTEWASAGFYWGIGRQTLISGLDDGTLEDMEEIGANLYLQHRGHSLKFEFLDRDSNFTPVRRYNLDARYSVLPDPILNVSLDGGLFRIYHKDTDLVEWGLNAGSIGRWRVADRLNFLLSAQFRRVDRRSDLGRGWYLDGNLSYDLGKTRFELRLTGSQERWEVQNDTNLFRAQFSVRREF